MIKTNGAEFKKFYSDPLWEDGCYHDDVLFKINGVESDIPEEIKDTDLIEFEGGFFMTGDDVSLDFEKIFLKWQKAQTDVIVAVQVPKDKLMDLQTFIKSISGEVLL